MKLTTNRLHSTGTEIHTIHDLLHGFDDRFQKVVEEIKNNSTQKSKILDVACGEGKIWQLFPHYDITGIDFSRKNLSVAKKYLKPVLGSVEKLPFKNNSFDCIVISEILEHVENPEKILHEANRVLKAGGKLILTFANTSGLQMRLSLLFWGRNPTLNYPSNFLHIKFFDLNDIYEMLKKTNLAVIKKRGCSFLAFHKENFKFYLPVPRIIRVKGGDLFPTLSIGMILVLEKTKSQQ